MSWNVILPVLATAGAVAAAWPQAGAPAAGQGVTVSGTVVDLACKFGTGQSGPAHVPCAQMCARAGVPFGILTADGKLYIPATHGESSNTRLLEFVEQEVAATGKVFPAAGAYTIDIATIAKK